MGAAAGGVFDAGHHALHVCVSAHLLSLPARLAAETPTHTLGRVPTPHTACRGRQCAASTTTTVQLTPRRLQRAPAPTITTMLLTPHLPEEGATTNNHHHHHAVNPSPAGHRGPLQHHLLHKLITHTNPLTPLIFIITPLPSSSPHVPYHEFCVCLLAALHERSS